MLTARCPFAVSGAAVARGLGLGRLAGAALRSPLGALLMRIPIARRALLGALGVPGDPFGAAFRDDPYPLYRRLRGRDPVHLTRIGVWLVTGYAEAATVLRDPRFGHVDQPHAAVAVGSLQRMRSHAFVARNPPDHTRLRRSIGDAFGAAAIEPLRPAVQAEVNRRLDARAPAHRMDVIADLAYPLAFGTVIKVFGIPDADAEPLRARADVVTGVLSSFAATPADLRRGDLAVDWLADYFGRLLAERRRAPRPDLITTLVQAERDGQIDLDEAVATSILMLATGYETVVGVIGNGLLALLRHPGELRRLRDDERLIRSAVEECVRYDPPVQSFGRVALEDVPMAGHVVRRGQQVYVLIGAANRDPARFSDPDRLDVARADNRHLGFGAGIHGCPGQHLARIEAQVALGTLVRRFEAMELLVPSPPRQGSIHGRLLRSLPIAF
jgi:cytochrome P450